MSPGLPRALLLHALLTGSNNIDALPIDWNENMLIDRIDGNGVNASALERDFANKLFGRCTDDTHGIGGCRGQFRCPSAVCAK